MKFFAQSCHLSYLKGLAVIGEKYGPLPCPHPHAFLPQPVNQVVTFVCHFEL
jgi:hypothetical protein